MSKGCVRKELEISYLLVRFSKVSMILGSLYWFSLRRQGLMYLVSKYLYMSRILEEKEMVV